MYLSCPIGLSDKKKHSLLTRMTNLLTARSQALFFPHDGFVRNMRCRCKKKKLLVSQRWTLDQRDLAQKRVEHAENSMLCHFAHHWGCAESFVCDVLPHEVADKLCWRGDGQGQATDVREQIDKLECPFFVCNRHCGIHMDRPTFRGTGERASGL